MIEIILTTRPCSHHINSGPKPNIVSPSMSRAWLLLPALLNTAHGYQHFFGPPAVGFGVGLVSVHRNFPVATSIVSRRSSRSYSQQSFVHSTPFGTSGSDSLSLFFTFSIYCQVTTEDLHNNRPLLCSQQSELLPTKHFLLSQHSMALQVNY